MRGTSVGDPVGGDLACPRCGAPVAPEMPSVGQILAARRTPRRTPPRTQLPED